MDSLTPEQEKELVQHVIKNMTHEELAALFLEGLCKSALYCLIDEMEEAKQKESR